MAEALKDVSPEPHSHLRGVTGRAVIIGLLLVFGEVVVITFSEPVARSSSMNVSHFPVGFLMWFVLVVMCLNPAIKRINPRHALSPAELFTIAAMGLVGAHIPGSGLMGFFLGTLAAPFYFASPENRWEEVLHPHIPSWLAPRDEGGAMQAFFEGAPAGVAIPWHAWIAPMFWWLCMIGALSFALLCIAVVFRKQWVENERLVYPLISPVADLIARSDAPGLLPRIARSRLFWVGFGIGFGILTWNIGGYFFGGWPRIHYQGGWWDFLTGFPRMTSRLNLYIVGFGYFANEDVLLSLWVFYLIYWVQTGAFNRIGYDLGPGTGSAAEWMCAGALFALVGWGMWVARGHLIDVVKKALNSSHRVDDRAEMLSYRTAFFGFLAASGFVILWLGASGMAYWVALLLLLAIFVTYVGLAKVVSESGLLYLAWTVSPQALVTSGVGAEVIPPGSHVSMGFTNGLFFHGKGMFMPAFAQAGKMADLARVDARRMALCMGLSLLLGIPLCFYLSLTWGYTYGAYNFGGFPFIYGRDGVFPATLRHVLSTDGIATPRMVFFAIGGVVMTAMNLLRYRFTWWPLHPIGLAVGGGGRATKSTFSLFVAWICKFLILRIGGVTLYQQCRPLFTGLLVGYSLGVGLSFIVDIIWFPGNGHWIHLY